MLNQLVTALKERIEDLQRPLKPLELQKLIRRFPRPKPNSHPFFNKSDILAAYQQSVPLPKQNPHILTTLTTKPIRTQSGVATVTLLTKPHPCPGNCLFCPNDPAQPKSYLSSEPAAARALKHNFDPFAQVTSRLLNLAAMGHNISKVELIILGGTFTAYPKDYQEWFIKEALRALSDSGWRAEGDPQKELRATANDFFGGGATTGPASQVFNVGLVIETRPDHITPENLTFLRSLGCTKIQLGVQSVNSRLLRLNHRSTTLTQIKDAFALLRLYGFKIHAHFMANLCGSTPELDKQDFAKFFSSPHFRPDELKLYPCSLIASAPLYQLYLQNKYQPYSSEQLLNVLTHHLALVPEYCRVTRMIRDISSHDIVAGNKTTNLRQLVEQNTPHIQEIRSREVKNKTLNEKNLILDEIIYDTSVSQEYFLQWIDSHTRQIAGFLRLSLPCQSTLAKYLADPDFAQHYPAELTAAPAIIREIHIYGVVAGVGEKNSGQTQHLGLGKKLLERAEKIAREHSYGSLAVISALGTLDYYKKLGFSQSSGQIYQVKSL
ncbi:tRNA uridine(34) 5-carboxymethylaminomethyl modification radical SAM/GNAT enzyme Elp3 [Microgenomates group bacterium]|nr:tRNA uridine(34) 5-carboxymethylaminomethyl modification radical SAM/GNAT enzyme Elp3 [Microgenomates group bacterium]